MHNHQGVKAILSKSEAKEQLYAAMNDYDKQIDKAKYLPDEISDSKAAKTLEQLQNTRKAIELTVTLLS